MKTNVGGLHDNTFTLDVASLQLKIPQCCFLTIWNCYLTGAVMLGVIMGPIDASIVNADNSSGRKKPGQRIDMAGATLAFGFLFNIMFYANLFHRTAERIVIGPNWLPGSWHRRHVDPRGRIGASQPPGHHRGQPRCSLALGGLRIRGGHVPEPDQQRCNE